MEVDLVMGKGDGARGFIIDPVFNLFLLFILHLHASSIKRKYLSCFDACTRSRIYQAQIINLFPERLPYQTSIGTTPLGFAA